MINEHVIQMNAMPRNSIKKSMQEGKVVFGGWLSIPHPVTVEIMAGAGYDWLLADFEHAPLDIQNGLSMLQAMRYSPVVPLARVPMTDIGWFKRLLDIGFMGLMAPLVRNKEDVQAAVQLAKYPPEGIRGVAGSHRASGYGAYAKEYLQLSNDETMVIIQIENAESVDNVKEILSVKGVDCLFVGPMDLSTALGTTGDYQNPRYVKAVQQVEEAAKEARVPLGTVVRTHQDAQKRVEQGYQFIGTSSDVRLLASSARKDVEQIDLIRDAIKGKR